MTRTSQLTLTLLSLCLVLPFMSGCNMSDAEMHKRTIKRAEGGDVDAQYTLGLQYYAGHEEKGIPQDIEEGLKWYKKAAEQGHESAISSLVFHYRNYDENIDEAKKWLKKAAEHGDEWAKSELEKIEEDKTNE